MFKLLVLLVAIAAVGGFPRAGKPSFQRLGRPIPSGRIVGGQDADIADYPYNLALLWYGHHTCEASIIGSKWAVTAAYCVYWSAATHSQVVAGTADLKGGQTIQVAAIYHHPQFDSIKLDYDISVLELEEEITVANSAPIALHDSGYTAEEGSEITITGWGAVDEIGDFSDVLQVVVTKVVSNEVCNEVYGGAITNRMMCAGNLEEGGKDACLGDFGGPLVVDGKLYAIVSQRNDGCGRPGYPGVNSKVSEVAMREFVRNVTGL